MGNCSCIGSGPQPGTGDTGSQKYKLLIIGPTFSGKTTFLKALQILYGNGFDEVSNDIFKDIMIRQIIHCIKTILEHIASEDEKMENDEISYQSEITRDHSHLSVEDVSRHGNLSYSGGSIGFINRSSGRQSKSLRSQSNANNNHIHGINTKKFDNQNIVPAAEYFLTTKFSNTSSYFEWLSNKKFIDHLHTLWEDKQIQSIFQQNYYLSTKLPYSTKYFIDSILSKLTQIHNDLANGDGTGNNGYDLPSSTVGGHDSVTTSGNQMVGNTSITDDVSSHSKNHSRTTSLGRFNKQQNNSNDGSPDYLDHPRGINSMISVPMLSSNSMGASGIISGDGNAGNNNENTSSASSPNKDYDESKSDNNSSKRSKSISLRYRPSNTEILYCYHRTINRNKEKISLANKVTFEVWDVGGSKAEMKKWILYAQKTNIVVFMVSLYQVSMLKYSLQLFESIINTKYETWFGTQRAMNELIVMQPLSGGNNGANGNNANGNNNDYNTNGNGGNPAELAKLHSQSGNVGAEQKDGGAGGPNGTGPNGQGTGGPTSIDIARIPCVLMLNGRERLAEMINKEKLSIKQNNACIQFFSGYNGDTKNVDAIVEYISNQFMKALKRKESRIQVTPMIIDCIDIDNVKNKFDDITDLCVSASQRGR